MPWGPKPAAPVSFNAVDAILSAIHADPVWGWLEGYAHLYPNQYVDTAWFCDQGPTNAGALTLGDLLNLAMLGTPEFFAGEARIAQKLIGALHDRLFAAMCQILTEPADWCEPTITTVTGPHAAQSDVWVPFPTGSTSVQIGLQGVNAGTSGANTAAFITSDAGVADLLNIHGYDGSTVTWSGVWEGPFSRGVHNYVYLSAKYDYIADWHIRFGPCFGEELPYVPTEQPIPDGFTPRVVPPTAEVADLARILFAL